MSEQVTEIAEVVNAFADSSNKHDMNAFANLFADDAEFVNVVGLWWRGRAEIKAAHEFRHQRMFKESRLSTSDISTRFPAPDIAIARCRWTLEGHVSAGGGEIAAA